MIPDVVDGETVVEGLPESVLPGSSSDPSSFSLRTVTGVEGGADVTDVDGPGVSRPPWREFRGVRCKVCGSGVHGERPGSAVVENDAGEGPLQWTE